MTSRLRQDEGTGGQLRRCSRIYERKGSTYSYNEVHSSESANEASSPSLKYDDGGYAGYRIFSNTHPEVTTRNPPTWAGTRTCTPETLTPTPPGHLTCGSFPLRRPQAHHQSRRVLLKTGTREVNHTQSLRANRDGRAGSSRRRGPISSTVLRDATRCVAIVRQGCGRVDQMGGKKGFVFRLREVPAGRVLQVIGSCSTEQLRHRGAEKPPITRRRRGCRLFAWRRFAGEPVFIGAEILVIAQVMEGCVARSGW